MRSLIAAFFLASTALLALADDCSPLELVYARATTEPPQGITVETTPQAFTQAANVIWSKGYGAAGYSLFTNLTKLLPAATGYPVHYPANWQANISAPTGVKDMLARLDKQSKACPQQKFALGGHSQGAGVTVATIPKLPKEILDKVVAVTMFGGRPCPAQVQGRCKSFCNLGDGCMGGGAKGTTGGKGAGPPPKGAPPKGAPGAKGVPPKGKGGEPNVGAPPPPASQPPAPVPKSSPIPKGKGGEPNVAAPPPPASQPPAPVPKSPSHLVARQLDGFDCSTPVEEKGHQPIQAGSESAHTVYNKDGYYIKAAACYIFSQYKAAGGKAKA